MLGRKRLAGTGKSISRGQNSMQRYLALLGQSRASRLYKPPRGLTIHVRMHIYEWFSCEIAS